VRYRILCKVCGWDIILDEKQLEWLEHHFDVDKDDDYVIFVEK